MEALTLYTSPTPNGWKVSILLEELRLPYNVKLVHLQREEQKQASFTKLNPNGRIPVLVDHSKGEFAVFESGAIMIYLAEREGRFLPKDTKARSQVIQWVMFQMAGLGPMQGQATYFYRYAPDKIEHAIHRYQNETRRLYGVLNEQLTHRKYLVGDCYTIADMINFTWVFCHEWAGISLEDFPHLRRWCNTLLSRPAVRRGLDVPTPNKLKEMLNNQRLQKKWIKGAQKISVQQAKL